MSAQAAGAAFALVNPDAENRESGKQTQKRADGTNRIAVRSSVSPGKIADDDQETQSKTNRRQRKRNRVDVICRHPCNFSDSTLIAKVYVQIVSCLINRFKNIARYAPVNAVRIKIQRPPRKVGGNVLGRSIDKRYNQFGEK